MLKEFSIKTPSEGLVTITKQVAQIVEQCHGKKSLCHVFVPHTTAGVTINENADPDVVKDMLLALNHMVPDLAYQHGEGNSPAHVKASLVGASVSIPIVNGVLYLGTWQGIYFCEFDGPRQRKFCVSIL